MCPYPSAENWRNHDRVRTRREAAPLSLCGAYCGDSYWLDLPDDARIIAFEPIPDRAGFILTFYSERFAPVLAGQPIPELVWQLPGNRSQWGRR
jgi:hypothetical protein